MYNVQWASADAARSSKDVQNCIFDDLFLFGNGRGAYSKRGRNEKETSPGPGML